MRSSPCARGNSSTAPALQPGRVGQEIDGEYRQTPAEQHHRPHPGARVSRRRLLRSRVTHRCQTQSHWRRAESRKPTSRLGGHSVAPPSSSAGAPAAIAGLNQRHVGGPARTRMLARANDTPEAAGKT
jgi:hypothetical protein